MANWERKSSYLLHEIVKFRTYLECLHAAGREKERVYAERAEREKGSEEVEVREGGAEDYVAEAERNAESEGEEEGLEMGALDVKAKEVAV